MEPAETSPRSVDVLAVEDNDGDAHLMETLLREASSQVTFSMDRVTRISDLAAAVERQRPDVILLDLSLPDSQGMDTLLKARELVPDIPVVVMTGLDDERIDTRTAELGAHGYVVKGELSPGTLRRQIRHAIELSRYASELESARSAAAAMATQDPLTGLANRLVLNDRIQRLLKQARRSGTRAAVLMVDLDRFKAVNDTFGHALGDEILRCISKRIGGCVRESDTVARLGGDEFVVLLANLVREMDAARVAGKMVSAVRKPIHVEGRSYAIAASVGIATYPSDAPEPDQLLAAADAAMYHAKRAGGSQYRFDREEMTVAAVGRLEIERGLRFAVERDELELRFQPLVPADGRGLVGLEALVRWRHPEHGLLPPSDFLQIAEESGLIVEIGEWVLREATRQIAAWRREFPEELSMSVNVSTRQLRDLGFPDLVAHVLREHDLPGSALGLDVPEGAFMDESGAVMRSLCALSELGVGIEIDDFGTGSSSLAKLREVPLDCIKVDRRFVQGLPEDESDAMLMGGLISLVHGLGARCVAEGVETPEQWVAVRDLGCDLLQGHLFGLPADAEEVTTFVEWGRSGWREAKKPHR